MLLTNKVCNVSTNRTAAIGGCSYSTDIILPLMRACNNTS